MVNTLDEPPPATVSRDQGLRVADQRSNHDPEPLIDGT
jgi:hypothetical protein